MLSPLKMSTNFLAGVGATRVTQEGNKFPLKKKDSHPPSRNERLRLSDK